ncbi:MAG: response regulator [Sulfuricurvum sp.]|nr:response regulator [Sulfuricurvum sp.]
MYKILIVDDQSLNQTLLEAYITQYCDKSGETVEISKADNGMSALTMAHQIPFDLVFMDILMPNMNGIEATKHLHRLLPKAIIVIVSTQEDEENQIQALRNGAKDYCIKPIQPDVFKHRLQLYLTMLRNAKGYLSSKHSINPFTQTIFCYKTTYRIENEEDLTQLWESLLSLTKESVRTNFISDLIRFIYQMGLVMLSRNVHPEIILEENADTYFFSILNIDVISPEKITQLIRNYFDTIDYQLRSDLLSFKVMKEITLPLNDQLPPSTVHEPSFFSSESPRILSTQTLIYEKERETLHRFDFMDEEDLDSLDLKLHDLSTQFMWMGSQELSIHDVDQIINAFERISSLLLLYTETQTLGMAIRNLATIIRQNEAIFISLAPQMAALCKSFNNDLILWSKSVFFDGAPSVDYMDASILSNIQMIESFLVSDTKTDNDDGFEFF